IGVLVVDLLVVDARPVRLAHLLPAREGAKAPFKHPFRLGLLGRDVAHRVLVEALGRALHLDVGDEAVLVLLANLGDLLLGVGRGGHHAAPFASVILRPSNALSDARNADCSAMPRSGPKLTRNAQRARPSGTPMAASTCDGPTLPDEHAAPELTAMPSRSSAISAFSA